MTEPFVLTDEHIDLLTDKQLTLWDRKLLETAIRLYEAGNTLRAVGTQVKKSHNTVLAAFRLIGVPIRSRGDTQRKFTTADEDFMLDCSIRGMTVIALATFCRTTRETIDKALVRARKRKAACPKCKISL